MSNDTRWLGREARYESYSGRERCCSGGMAGVEGKRINAPFVKLYRRLVQFRIQPLSTESVLFCAVLSFILYPNPLGCVVDEFLYMSLFYDNSQTHMLSYYNGNFSSTKPFSPLHTARKNTQEPVFVVPMNKNRTAA